MRQVHILTLIALLITLAALLASAAYRNLPSSWSWRYDVLAPRCPSLPTHPTQPARSGRTEVVILLTQRRSGSSVVGEIFNRRVDVSYFYEPLLPFPEVQCEELLSDRLQVIEKIANCRFDLEEHYARGFKVSKCTDKYARCMEKKVCFTGGGKYSQFLGRDTELCKLTKDGRNQCPSPIDLEGLSKHCRQSLFRAMKVIYLCKLEWLVPLLSNTKVNVKVVHLVRDPRATVNSRTRGNKLLNRINALRTMANYVCSRIKDNVVFAEFKIRTGPLKDRYMRVRHEDFAVRPVETTQAIYDFVGINMHPSIKEWLSEALSPKNDAKLSLTDSQGTKRNPAVVVSDWRKSLSWEETEEIQKSCFSALNILGYRVFESEKELTNVEDNPSFTYELPE